MQNLLDRKAAAGLSFSVVGHLRWDLKQIFELAVAEGLVQKNPASLLFVPKGVKHPVQQVMSFEQVSRAFGALAQRERLIVKIAVLAGMRPGEIFGLTWGRLQGEYAEIRQRIYRGQLDGPKTLKLVREVALSKGLLSEINEWRRVSIDTRPDAWVFPSETMRTPVSKDNCWATAYRSKAQRSGARMGRFPGDETDPFDSHETLEARSKSCSGSAWAYARCQSERVHPSPYGTQD